MTDQNPLLARYDQLIEEGERAIAEHKEVSEWMTAAIEARQLVSPSAHYEECKEAVTAGVTRLEGKVNEIRQIRNRLAAGESPNDESGGLLAVLLKAAVAAAVETIMEDAAESATGTTPAPEEEYDSIPF